ncbi:Parvovirus coat protein VP1-like protein [Cytobacillus sp. FJAT-54145]|uniref:Parvovirus coat protein VP1-like protein n=1 Tax=Cytobacillus spartinae TaxID=3299023 RepID=A0ABW6KMQ1_9BACI
MRRRRGGFCVPRYRWCGPGCSGPGAPTNDVDACCMAHDMCYRRFGPSGYCDQRFMNCLKQRMHRNSRYRQDASLFYNVMKLKQGFRSY